MATNQPHEFSLSSFTLKGKNIDKMENMILEILDKMHSDSVIINDPRERYKPGEVIKPNKVIMFHIYEIED